MPDRSRRGAERRSWCACRARGRSRRRSRSSRRAAASTALIAIGAVIRGDTPHFDFICAGCSPASTGGGQVPVPVAFGVLTCDNTQQAEDRAGGKGGNKGIEAALAALEMASLFERLRG